jgi:DNA topoisomerase-1
LVEKDCTIIIAEKPDAAERIAEALSRGEKFEKKTEENTTYYTLERENKKILVVPASGHLYTVTQERGGRSYYPVFTFKWVPKHVAERGDTRTKNMINLFTKLSKKADEFVNAADYDIEGSLIGYTILKYACKDKDKEAKRMKFSTLTEEELNSAYVNMMPKLDRELAEAGQTRHEIDWLYGVNLSRALTLSALKQNKKYVTLSIGRVQGPTLQLIVQREAEIRSFVPTPYWEIKAIGEIDKKEYELQFEKEKIEKKVEVKEVEKCSGKMSEIVNVDEKEIHRVPPEPFDVGTLQKEAYRFFGYTPRRTLDIAERLYLDALISYPRTSSQKLPPTINYEAVLKGLNKIEKYRKSTEILLAERTLKPNEGKKDDPAHPAIYPTGKLPERELTPDEAKIYDLVVKRFMATFGKPAVRLSTRVEIKCNGYNFYLHGRRVIEEGWIIFYHPYVEAEEVILPHLKVGQKILLKKVVGVAKFTEPPPRYNPASLLKVMEENGLGTKATRADIIDTLYDRGYVREERMVATDIGFNVIETLNKYCKDIVSTQLTRELEEKMDDIENGKEIRKNVLTEAVSELLPALQQIKIKEKDIGTILSEAIKKEMLRRRIVGSCPSCGTGNLIIIRSRKTGKQFIGCTNFFKGKCRKSLPLPQKARVTTTEKICKTCGYPIITVKWAKRRPFTVCVNTECPSKPPPKLKMEGRGEVKLK